MSTALTSVDSRRAKLARDARRVLRNSFCVLIVRPQEDFWPEDLLAVPESYKILRMPDALDSLGLAQSWVVTNNIEAQKRTVTGPLKEWAVLIQATSVFQVRAKVRIPRPVGR